MVRGPRLRVTRSMGPARMRRLMRLRPQTPGALHNFVREVLGVSVMRECIEYESTAGVFIFVSRVFRGSRKPTDT